VNTLVAGALTLFSRPECANYIRNCGYLVPTEL
jgi:hypothetical protein